MLTILILAAGASSRMRGADKLLQQVNQQPLLHHMAQSALATDCPVFVTLPAEHGPRHAALETLPLTTVAVADAASGMAHSIRAGVAALPDSITAVMILPADMPDLNATDLCQMRNAWHNATSNDILRATSADGTPGHPVIFPSRCFNALQALSGDQGAKSLLQDPTYQLKPVPLPGTHALTDLDTPQDWARWRSTQGETKT